MLRYSLLTFLFLSSTFYGFSQCEFTIEASPSSGCMQSHSDAIFTDLVRTEFNGVTIKKTDNKNKWDAGGFSTASIQNNGFAETTISQTNKTRIFGLSATNNRNKNKIDDIEYAIVLRNWGGGEIRESGSYKTGIGNYSIGDIFKIAIEDGIIRYYKNNTLLYESTAVPAIPQFVDLAFEQPDAEITDVKIVNTTNSVFTGINDNNPNGISTYQWYQNNELLSESASLLTLNDFDDGDIIECRTVINSGQCSGTLVSNKIQIYSSATEIESDLFISATSGTDGCFIAEGGAIWKANIASNILIDGNGVKKTQGYNTSNGGIYSENKVYNNGYLEFQTSDPFSRKMLGLSSQDFGSSESTIQFAFYIESNGQLVVYENGSWKAEFSTITANDTLRIAVENNKVKYYLNSELLYLSDQTPALPLIADGTIQSIDGTFTNAIIANPTQGNFTANGSNDDTTDLIWLLNGQSIGESGTAVSILNLSENDILSCSYSKSIAGCGSQDFISNSITIKTKKSLSTEQFFIEGLIPQNPIGMAEEEIVWNPESMVNVSYIENEVKKIQGYNQYNAGATSINKVKNNGYFEYIISENDKNKSIGLDNSSGNFSYQTMDYAIVLGQDAKFTIYESNSWKLGNQSYSIGDVLRIAVENNQVKYYQNESLIFSSANNPNLPLLVSIALSDMGSSVKNGIVANENSGKFEAHFQELGESPSIEWNANDLPLGITGNTLEYSSITNNDIITCSVIPDLDGCNANSKFESNFIRFKGPATLTDWLGAFNTAWNHPANWSDGVPNENLSARIPADRPHQPIIYSPQVVKNILVEANAELRIAGNFILSVYGDFRIEGEFFAGPGNISIKGNGNRKIAGSDLQLYNLVLNLDQADNEIELLSDITISNETVFLNGKLRANGHEVIYLVGSSTSEGNSNSFIDGKVRKIGNTAFHFPIGSGDVYAPIEISAPQKPTDAFSAQYFNTDPNEAGYHTYSQDGSLQRISSCEYWMINSLNENSEVSVSLSYEKVRSCGVEDPSFLQVLHWNGDLWENKGIDSNGFIRNDTQSESGMITSELPVSDFSPFTIGSMSSINTLPVELVSFSAKKQGRNTDLEWITDSETNNSFFTLERCDDARNFKEIARVSGAGSSREKLIYNYLDHTPVSGTNYYRLSQTDFDGTKVFFDIKTVFFEQDKNVVIYPNPNKGIFTIVRDNENPVHMSLHDSNGKTLWLKDTDEMLIEVKVYELPKGMYFLNIDDGLHAITQKVVIK